MINKFRKSSLILFLMFIVIAMFSIIVNKFSGKESSENSVNKENKEISTNRKPVIAVKAIKLEEQIIPIRVSAHGFIMAWQEAIVGSEANNLRLTEVKVNVGDSVSSGQTLAVFASETIAAELAQANALTSEARVISQEAIINANRARSLQKSGALADQQIQQYINSELSASARLKSALASEKALELKLSQTKVLAPDSGIISSSTATVGAVISSGQELFKLIRQNRLEWRAEVAAFQLQKLKPGQKVILNIDDNQQLTGTVRMLSPKVNSDTLNGLVYVDLPDSELIRHGMFVQGDFQINEEQVMTLPQSAIFIRDGVSYVFRIDSGSKVQQTRIKTGLRIGDTVEILAGVDASSLVVQRGGGFLGDGDLVEVVNSNANAEENRVGGISYEL